MYKKRIVIITGASRGIGLATAIKFLDSGCKVYITYKSSPKNHFKKFKVFKNKNLIPIRCDMTKFNQIKKLKNKIKENYVDVLVNNVGDVLKRSSFMDSTDELWKKSIDLNLMSTVRSTLILSKKLTNSRSAVVVNISSIAGRAGGSGDSLHYGVAKGAVNVLTSGLAREFRKKKFNIRVIAIAPSIVDTDFQKRHSSKKRLKTIINQTPIKRIAQPEEIARLAFWLSLPESNYISGDTIYVTGGR